MTQEYVTTQQVLAWETTQDGQAGYTVKAENGTTTWKPKADFEATHVAMGHTGHLQPHERRVVAERAQNDDRVQKLAAFLESDRFQSLDSLKQQHLQIQHDAMTLLANVLADRIDDFAPAPVAESATA
jgi:hypothetical protein